jgi:predicted lysophospholipase L1 biosynthesis ABC-type transport system permease subunit
MLLKDLWDYYVSPYTTPLTFTPIIGIKTLFYTLILAVGYAIFICLPVILQIRRIKPAELFQEELDNYQPFSSRSLISLVPAAAGFYLLAVTQANSIFVGSVFCGGIIFIAFTFSFLGLSLIRLSKRLTPENISFKLALRIYQRRLFFCRSMYEMIVQVLVHSRRFWLRKSNFRQPSFAMSLIVARPSVRVCT